MRTTDKVYMEKQKDRKELLLRNYTIQKVDVKEEESEDEYQPVCDAKGCNCVLGISEGIYNITKDGSKITVCSFCGQNMMMDGWIDTDRPYGDTDEEEEKEEPKQMILLELYSGTGSFGKVAKEKFGLKVISLDHMDNATPSGNPEEKPTILSDIMEWDFESVDFVPDILTASPPCQTFSNFCHKHRTIDSMNPKTLDGMKGDNMLEKTIEIINFFLKKNPKMKFFMENPKARMRHSYLISGLPKHERQTVSYCKYGFDYQKDTDIWTNAEDWMPIPKCCKEFQCDFLKTTGRTTHKAGVRTGNPETMKYQEGGAKTLLDKYKIPPDLIEEMLSACVE